MTEPKTADLRALLALVKRLEAAERGSYDLDADIYEAFGYEVKRISRPSEGRWGKPTRGRSWAFLRDSRWEAMRHYTASLDAAMTLVPEGHGWRLWVPDKRQERDDDRPFVTVWGSGRTNAPRDTICATPALALTAAALRARATQGQSHAE